MKQLRLTPEEILCGYDAVTALYPYVPPLSHWRAWEYAAYQNYRLEGSVLDVGCGDGRYFQLIWPQIKEAVGIDLDPVVARLGEDSGVYRKVHIGPAHQVPEPDESFDHVFANCSLEHMDQLNEVLSEIYRCLKPGGSLVCSVVTNRLQEWAPLPYLTAMAGYGQVAESLRNDFSSYHHLVNPLSPEEWEFCLMKSGFTALEHVPILPKYNSGIFLLMDGLWHVRKEDGGEMGNIIHPFLSENPKFPRAFRNVIAGLLEMEQEWQDCSGAVFVARKPR